MQSSSMIRQDNNNLSTKIDKNMITLEKCVATIKSQLA